ncbi:MAG TPA: hypothetical protein DDX01_01175, partial [Holosporales bacterium]|nr:hypothetical protein [Holosporales bacterium]
MLSSFFAQQNIIIFENSLKVPRSNSCSSHASVLSSSRCFNIFSGEAQRAFVSLVAGVGFEPTT